VVTSPSWITEPRRGCRRKRTAYGSRISLKRSTDFGSPYPQEDGQGALKAAPVREFDGRCGSGPRFGAADRDNPEPDSVCFV
jgi:hypothetical protein